MTSTSPTAPAALKALYQEIWATTKAMWQALAAGRDAELERLLAQRQRLLAEADAHPVEGRPADADEILALARKTSELNETIMATVRAARDRVGEQLATVRRGAVATRGYGARQDGTGVITNVDG